MSNDYFVLLRVNHWFKNIFIFAGTVLGIWYVRADVISSLLSFKIIGAFFLTSMVSSTNYIINQIADSKFDALHPQKKKRPIPSGRVSSMSAFLIAACLFLSAIVVSAYWYPITFSYTLLTFFVAGIVYNIAPIRLKDVLFLDVVSESINNPIRFLLGWFLILPHAFPPSSILAITWSAGAILMSGKRYDELVTLGKKLVPYRKSFKHYTEPILRFMVMFYTLVTIFLFGLLSYRYRPQLLLSFPVLAAFLIWIVQKILRGEARASTVESFMLSKKFMLYALFTVIPVLYLMFFTITL